MLNFYEFIEERLLIYRKKEIEKQPFPWTNDVVLQKHKFCNAQRHLDKGTKILQREIINNNNLKPVEKLQNIIFYRMFNTAQHFDIFPIILNWKEQKEDVLKLAESYASQGKKMFNNAYAIRAAKPKWKNIIESCANVDYEKLHDVLICGDAKDAIKEIKRQLNHAGDFIAGQILLDCGYNNKICRLTGDDFIIVGPGALDGLKILYGDDLDGKTPEDLVRHLTMVAPKFIFLQPYPKGSNYQATGRMSYMDIQHCLCEYRKYVNWSKGIGMKRLFHH